MDAYQVDAIVKALTGCTYEEWIQLRDRIDQEFDTAIKQVQFTRQDGEDVKRLIAIENEWPRGESEAAQTRMGF